MGIGHRLAKLWGFCGGSGRPGMEHQAPQLLELMATFRVTQRHWVGFPAGLIPRRIADSVCLVALMVQAGAEHISGNSAGVPPPEAPETPRVAVADGTGESHRHRAGDRERGMGRELRSRSR